MPQETDALLDELVALVPQQAAQEKPETTTDGALPRLKFGRREDPMSKVDRDLFDRQTAELEQLFSVREPTMVEKGSIAVGRGVAQIAKAPEFLGKIGEELGIPPGALERHAPYIKGLADWGRSLEEAADVAEDPRFAAQDFGSNLVRGAASTLPFAVAGPLAGWAGQLFVGAAQTAIPMYEDVLEATGDETKAWQAAAIGLGLGATELAGAGRILRNLDRATFGGVRKALLKAAAEGSEEALQELVQTIGESVSTKKLTDQEVRWLQELSQGGEAGVIGAIIGSGLSMSESGVGSAIHGLRKGQPTGWETAGPGPAPNQDDVAAGRPGKPQEPGKGKTVAQVSDEARGVGQANRTGLRGFYNQSAAEMAEAPSGAGFLGEERVRGAGFLGRGEPTKEAASVGEGPREGADVLGRPPRSDEGGDFLGEPEPDPESPEGIARRILSGEEVPLEELTPEAVREAARQAFTPPPRAPAPGEAASAAPATQAVQEPAGTAKGGGVSSTEEPLVYEHGEDVPDVTIPKGSKLGPTEPVAISDLKLTQVERFRQGVDEERVDALVKAMTEGKAIPPIVAMRKKDGSLIVLDGHHRAVAADSAGFDHVPVRIVQEEGQGGPSEEDVRRHAIRSRRAAFRGMGWRALEESAAKAGLTQEEVQALGVHGMSSRDIAKQLAADAPALKERAKALLEQGEPEVTEEELEGARYALKTRREALGPEPAARLGDAIKALRGLVTSSEQPDSDADEDPLIEALQRAETVLDQRQRAKAKETEIDQALRDFVHAWRVPPEEEFGSSRERAQTALLQAAKKRARALLDVFDAAKKSSTQAPAALGEPVQPLVGAEAVPDTGAAELLPRIAHEDIPTRLAVGAFTNTSHSPEARGRQVQQTYIDQMEAAEDALEPLADTPAKRALLKEELALYRDGYLARAKAWLNAHARVASPMVTGPANFPVERNRKAGATADKRLSELVEFQKRSIERIRKKLTADARAAENETRHPGRASREVAFEGGTVRLDHESDRLRILFDEKPEADMLRKLRASGFKWAPSVKAWQRQWTPNAERATERLLEMNLAVPANPSEAPKSSGAMVASTPAEILSEAERKLGPLESTEPPPPPVEQIEAETVRAAEAIEQATPAQSGGVGNATHQAMRDIAERRKERDRRLWPVIALEKRKSWADFMAERRTNRKGRWDGNLLNDKEGAASRYYTDGRAIVVRAKMVGPKSMDGKTKLSRVFEAPPKGVMRHVADKMIEGVLPKSTNGLVRAELVGMADSQFHDPRVAGGIRNVFAKVGEKIHMADADRLRLLIDATKADAVWINPQGKAPWALTRDGEVVAALMPVTVDGGSLAERVMALPEDKRGRELEKERGAIAHETGIDDDEPMSMHAFPGDLAAPLVRAAKKLLDRLRRTPPLQTGPDLLPTARWQEKAIMRYVDYFEPVARVERALAGERRRGEANLPDAEDAYLQETLRRGKSKDQLEEFERTFQKPILRKMRSARITLEELDAFLMARNAHDGNKLIRARNPDKGLEYDEDGNLVAMGEFETGERNLTRYGMTDEQATEILEAVKADPRAGAFEEIGRTFDSMNDATLAAHVASGRMTQEQVDALKKAQPHYAPGRTDMRNEDGQPPQMVNLRKRVGRPFQKALGRESRAQFPLAFAFAQAEQAIVQGEVNKVRRAFLAMVRAYSDQIGDAFQIVDAPKKDVLVNGERRTIFDQNFRSRSDVLVVWEDGNPVAIQFDQKHLDLARALTQLGPTQVEGLGRLAAAFNRMRAAMLTRFRPFFWPFNLIRDVKGVFYVGNEFGLRFATAVTRDVGKAMVTLIGKKTSFTPYLERYKRAGAPISFMDLSDLTKQLDRMQAALDRAEPSTGDQAIAGFQSVRAAMEKAADVSENAARLSAFVHAIEDLGMSDERAAAYAKEIQNFERKGLWGNFISAWYLFANAGIQSSRRFAQALGSPGVRKSIIISFAAAMAWDQMMRALGGVADDGEDEWDKIPDWEKQGNFIFMYPDGSGRRVTIPAPFVFGAINYTGQQLSGLLSRDITPGEFLASSLGAWTNALNPLGSIAGSDGAGFVRALSPDIARLPIELVTNRDWRGKPIYPPTYGSRDPDSSKSWPDTHPAAVDAARWLNEVTLGDEFEPGLVDVAPETLEHLARFFASGLPQDIVDVADKVVRKSQGEPITVRETPLLRRILREPSPFASWGEQEDLIFALEAEGKRLKAVNRYLPHDVYGLIEEGKRIVRAREKEERPKHGTPLDELPTTEKQKALKRLDQAAQRWNKKAQAALKRVPVWGAR